MIGFKGCPRCQGDVQTARDRFGEYVQCLQCGHVSYIQNARKNLVLASGKQKAGRPRKRSSTETAA